MLHGSIQINGAVIGAWEVHRTEKLTGADDYHDYRYRVQLNGKVYAGPIEEHAYTDGAPALLARMFLAMCREAHEDNAQRLEGYAQRIMEVQDL